MVHSIGNPEVDPIDSRIPDLKGKIPTLDDLIRRLDIPDYLKPLPPPKVPGDPFGPVPIIPPPAPTWPYGPPFLGGAPTTAPLFGVSSNESVLPQNLAARRSLSLTPREEPGGLLGMIERSSVIGPSDQHAPPAGGLVELLHEYLRNGRERSN